MKIVVKLPYPRTILGLDFLVKKEVGFLFTNQAIENFRENNNINNSTEYEKFIADFGDNRLITEIMYGAAQAYCMAQLKKQHFTKSKLITSIAAAPQEIQKRIVGAWEKSQKFGLVESKKKVI